MKTAEQPSTPASIADFSYSKLSHFALFKNLPFKSFNVDTPTTPPSNQKSIFSKFGLLRKPALKASISSDPDPETCDLKVYQDYLIYCYIAQNIKPGSRILEIGGGDSRILKFFSGKYECWNVDKCEGLGNGPIQFKSPHYKIVYDYMGTFNQELPDGYFDFVFSISALEHTPEDQAIRVNIVRDINRVMKPGCHSFHCFDAILRSGGKTWINGLIPYIYTAASPTTYLPPLQEMESNPDTYAMSRKAYESNWQPITKDSYEDFGRAISINILWSKSS